MIRNKFQILSDLKLKNVEAVVAIDPYHHLKDDNDLFPLSSFSNKLTFIIFHCNEYGRSVSYQSDRYGFSNPDNEWDNQTDFLIIGDRFVFLIQIMNGRLYASRKNNSWKFKKIKRW